MRSYHLQVKTILLLPSWFDAVIFSCLIALARTSNTVLNKSRENGLPQVLPDLRRKAVSPSPLSTVSAVSLSCMLFIMSRYVCFFYTQQKVCCFFFLIMKGAHGLGSVKVQVESSKLSLAFAWEFRGD